MKLGTNHNRIARYCLGVIGASWILIGTLRNIGTETAVKHFVQVLPVILAAIALQYRAGWVSSIGGPLFVVWLAGMFTLRNSWRWLIEANSHFIFPIEEAVFSGIIALSAIVGLFSAARTTSELRFAKRLGFFGTALAVQLTAMFLGTFVT